MNSGFKKYLSVGLKEYGIELSENFLAQLGLYFLELKKWNNKVNLIARKSSDEQIVESHFIDSLALLPFLNKKNTKVGTNLLDIGTGAGFPGLVCKTALPSLELSLVEPRIKRINFLRHIVRTLGLQGVSIYNCRIEDEKLLSPVSSLTPVTHITCRAVTEIGAFLQMIDRFAANKPVVLCMKGPKWQQELEQGRELVKNSNYELINVVEQTLPYSRAKRALLLFESSRIKNKL